MSPGFELDLRLGGDSHLILDSSLSQIRLMDDTRFNWLLLVPRVPGAREWVDLADAEQTQLWDEVRKASALLRALGNCDKLNLGALGNVVPQLHVHVVARRVGDAAWPGPVWGAGSMQRWESDPLAAQLARCRALWPS